MKTITGFHPLVVKVVTSTTQLTRFKRRVTRHAGSGGQVGWVLRVLVEIMFTFGRTWAITAVLRFLLRTWPLAAKRVLH